MDMKMPRKGLHWIYSIALVLATGSGVIVDQTHRSTIAASHLAKNKLATKIEELRHGDPHGLTDEDFHRMEDRIVRQAVEIRELRERLAATVKP